MGKGIVRRALILVFAGLLCLGMLYYSTRPEEKQPEITGNLLLWYTQEDLSPAVVKTLLDSCREETGLWFRAECFADEQALADAFETGRPDLFFCSHIRAAQIDRREPLAALAEALPVPETLTHLRPAVGLSFIPVGSRLPLLAVNRKLTSVSFDSLESLCAAAGAEPFFTSDDWSMLLYTAMSAKGAQMQGIPELDRNNADYRVLYNLLAGAAFRGGLALTEENAGDYVRQGLLPCAVVCSGALAGLQDADVEILPLPLPKGAERRRYPAELMGFALPGGADTETAGIFLQWLWSGQVRETALAAGLVPPPGTDHEGNADSELEKSLLSLSEEGTLFWPDAEESFWQNHAACEQRLREALDLLR